LDDTGDTRDDFVVFPVLLSGVKAAAATAAAATSLGELKVDAADGLEGCVFGGVVVRFFLVAR
jgi:predicted alpha-1,6-mannanase (GH76 family)